MKSRKLFLNTVSSLINQGLTILSGFVLPRLILGAYGSDINGLASSISQFLGFISFMQLGIGAVVQSSWYRPLAEKNDDSISAVYKSADTLFKKISYVLIVYTIALCVIFPLFLAKNMDPVLVILLVLAISLNLFSQYYLGITNQLLLFADQNAYIHLFSQSVLIIINLVVSYIIVKSNLSIVWLKLVTSVIYSLSPLFLAYYVRKKYKINKRIEYHEEPIKQKWNGLSQHLASVVMENTDVIVLTVFTSFETVSVYSVYHLVVNGIRQIINSLTVGIQAKLGNFVATNQNGLKEFFLKTESIFHGISTILFSCVLVLVCPFVKLYTNGIIDADYFQPVFATVITLAFLAYCYRLPYYALIKAYGHYKETQLSAIIEMLINIVVSVFFVIKFGLVGVAIGTLLANLYRTCYFLYYLTRKIQVLEIKTSLALFFVDLVVLTISVFFSQIIITIDLSISEWIIYGVISLSIISAVYLALLFLVIPKRFKKKILFYISNFVGGKKR